MSTLVVCIAMILAVPVTGVEVDPVSWPAITSECKPWAYNWWLGSAVDKENLAREMRRYRDGGLGGIHIVPIYGAKGAESRFIDYLSPKWMEMLAFAVEEGRKLDLGVDMTTGTGWCFGGPNVTPEFGGQSFKLEKLKVEAGSQPPKLPVDTSAVAIQAVAADGARVDLKPLLKPDGSVDWNPGSCAWTIYVLKTSFTKLMVKRAAPGGTGPMINPFYGEAMRRYLERFTEAFASQPSNARPRAMYHDSYEYFGAQWSPDLLAEFARRRGYRLEDQLAAFGGDGDKAVMSRVRADYRETVSDLMVEKVFPSWVEWCHQRGILTRNQAHGSPGNLLDLYALSDIPDTEMFGRGKRDPLKSGFDGRFAEGDRDPLVSKFASSAAHLAGKKLTAAEYGTWIAEHFCETLEELKCFADLFFAAGINHVFYVGSVSSPDDVAWPGWLFYASTQMNPRNSIWHDAPVLNDYITRCQSVLQAGAPDNEVLLYWPIHDRWHETQSLPEMFTQGGARWLADQPVGRVARQLWDHGIGFDYVSDRLLNGAEVMADRKLSCGAGRYRAIVVPSLTYMPEATLTKLQTLAKAGATVIFVDQLPKDVPGFGNLERRRAELQKLLASWPEIRRAAACGAPKDSEKDSVNGGQPQAAALQEKPGAGYVCVGDLLSNLAAEGVVGEGVASHPGALFIRRRIEDGCYLFIANQSVKTLNGWYSMATPAKSVAVMDPMTGRSGVAAVRKAEGDSRLEVNLHLEPGHSIILRTFSDRAIQGNLWNWPAAGDTGQELAGPWQVLFKEGGPVLPKAYELAKLESWTGNGDPDAERFAGTAVYRKIFDFAAVICDQLLVIGGNGTNNQELITNNQPRQWLDLGAVKHSARVTLNGQALGTLIMAPYRIEIPQGVLKAEGNVLEVEVTNLSANRIRDLDRRKVKWKIFHDINFPNIKYKPFDASNWPVFESGLLGPVRIMKEKGAL
jgi:hypothetical protein